MSRESIIYITAGHNIPYSWFSFRRFRSLSHLAKRVQKQMIQSYESPNVELFETFTKTLLVAPRAELTPISKLLYIPSFQCFLRGAYITPFRSTDSKMTGHQSLKCKKYD